MIKIGFDAKRYFHNKTGLGNYSRDLVRIMAQYYPENQYFLFNPKPGAPNSQTLLPSITSVVPKGFWLKMGALWRTFGLKSDIVRLQIDIYHGLSGELPFGLKSKATKTVVTIHDLIFMRYPKLYSALDRWIYFRKSKWAAENADKIIAISEQTKQDIIEFLKVDPNKISVVYQGCANAFKQEYSKEEISAVYEKYNLPDSYILNVGTVEPRKNALNIIKAIQHIDTNLVIVGRKTYPYQNEIDKFIGENKLEKKVNYLQGLTLTELAILYQNATIFVYPSVFEGFGIPIIEALYSKVPVITTAGGVFPEAGGPSSFYVQPNNIQSLSSAISLLLSDKNLRDSMIKDGLQFVNKLDDEKISSSINEIYESLIKDKSHTY
jgi:glycosyltransferase involved in cell wall biosynthesis